jgi:hypothetical protein
LVREDVVRLELDAVTHRFTAGNRIRLLIAGGSFPRWSATSAHGGEDPAKSTGWCLSAHDGSECCFQCAANRGQVDCLGIGHDGALLRLS